MFFNGGTVIRLIAENSCHQKTCNDNKADKNIHSLRSKMFFFSWNLQSLSFGLYCLIIAWLPETQESLTSGYYGFSLARPAPLS